MRNRYLAWLTGALFVCGCSDNSAVEQFAPTPTAIPTASSPTGAIERLESAYTRHDVTAYASLFTTDFEFAFAPSDVNRGVFPTPTWGRDDELASARNLLVLGNPAVGTPATNIGITMTTIVPINDQRADKPSPWHKEVTVFVALRADLPGGAAYQLRSDERFYLVRGDSARVAADANQPADASRWYIERWEDLGGDETAQTANGPLDTMPAHKSTWGELKALYH